MPSIKHPSALSPNAWPDIWPFQLRRGHRHADGLQWWFPMQPSAPFAELVRPTYPDKLAGSYPLSYNQSLNTWTVSRFQAQGMWFPTVYQSASGWFYVPSSLGSDVYLINSIINAYGAVYDSVWISLFASTNTLRCGLHYANTLMDSPAGAMPRDKWTHIAFTYWHDKLGYYGSGEGRIYVNGRVVAVNSTMASAGPLGLQEYVDFYNGGSGIFTRDVRFAYMPSVQPQYVWTPEQVLDQYENPFELYEPLRRKFYSIPKPDPSAVPPTYAPNESLTWVQKSSYIWALHPSNPLKEDKLTGNDLVVMGDTPPTPVLPDNTMEFHGGPIDSTTGAGWYRSNSTFIFGDDPLTAGNQTPPVVGGIACWIKIYSYPAANFARIFGQSSAAHAPVLCYTSGGLMAGYINNLTFYGTALPLNTWLHVALQNTTTTRKLYVNGAMVASSAQDSLDGYDQVFEIGQVLREGGSDYPVRGEIRQVSLINGDTWTDAEIAEMYSRPYAYYGEAAPGYVMTALGGDFTISGQNATLRHSYILNPVAGAFNITGAAASLLRSYRINPQAGAFTIAGQNADLRKLTIYRMNAEAGVFLITGYEANLLRPTTGGGAGRSYKVPAEERVVKIGFEE